MNKTGLINETYAFDTDDLQMHLVDSRQEVRISHNIINN